MDNIDRLISDYKLHNTTLVFPIFFLNKENKLEVGAKYSFLDLNENIVKEKLNNIEKNNSNFQKWINYNEYISITTKNKKL